VNDRGGPSAPASGRLRAEATAAVAAFQFLTVAPPVVRRLFTAREMGAAVGYYPLAGLALGAVLAGLHWALGQALPAGVVAALALGAWVLLTGALHLDGFLDTCDGLLGGFTPEARLRILRDERVGAYAVAGGMLLLLLKYSAIAASVDATRALLLAPLLGRWAISLAVVAFPYARPQGLGRDIKDQATWRRAALATAIALPACALIGGWLGALAAVAVAVLLLGVARFTLARIPGLTGDIYGAVCELSEAVVLVLFTVRFGT